MEKTKLTIEFSEIQMEILENEANMLGMTVEEFVKYISVKRIEETVEDLKYSAMMDRDYDCDCDCEECGRDFVEEELDLE